MAAGRVARDWGCCHALRARTPLTCETAPIEGIGYRAADG